jgi:hypothetical protein
MGSKRNQEQRKGIIEPGPIDKARRTLEPKIVTLQLKLFVL